MQRGFVHALAWSLATGAAVTLSWWGVHTVMSGTAYDAPQALPIPADRPVLNGTTQGAKPRSSSTQRPADKSPSASPSRPGSPKGTPGTPGDKGGASPVRTPSEGAQSSSGSGPAGQGATSGSVKSYSTDGGRATFDLGKSSATLVSATPATGWSMQVWTTESWIRVEFTSGTKKVSVFCTWHDHAPKVEIVES